MKRARIFLAALIVVTMAAMALARPATAAPPTPPTPPTPAPTPADKDQGSKVVLSWEEFLKITGYDPDKKDEQQVLTLPWSEVEELLGVDIKLEGGTTVDLPWDQFKALLNWSIKQKARQKEEQAALPADYVITNSKYAGRLTDDGAVLDLTVKINVLRKKGWKRIALLPSSVALAGKEPTLPDKAVLNNNGSAYELLTEESGEMTVTLPFVVAVEKQAGINRVSFPRVTAGSSVLDLTIDRENVEVKVAQAQSLVTKSADGESETLAAIPAGVPVSISWERALPKVEKVPPKLYAETHTLVAVADGMLLCQESIDFNILHAGVRELALAVPSGARVLTVSGPSIQDWREDGRGELQVVLQNEVVGSYSLRVAYEVTTTAGPTVPVIRARGVEREKGFVGVIAIANVEIAAGTLEGATSIDARQLPGNIVAMTNQPILLAFRYVAKAFTIPLSIRKHDEVPVLITIVDSAVFTSMQLNDGRRMTRVIYSVRNNRNQFLRLVMPAKAEIWSVSVSGNTVSPAKDTQGNVLVPLIRSTAGSRELTSFPVEIVYVETPDAVAPARGKLRVDLPTCAGSVPVMHVMFTYYLPAEGKYTVGWGKSGFSGPLALVDEFTTMSTGPGAQVVRHDAARQAQRLQRQVDAQVDRRARAAGAAPIRVRLPIGGTMFRLEKILALPRDRLYFEVTYSGWKAAE